MLQSFRGDLDLPLFLRGQERLPGSQVIALRANEALLSRAELPAERNIDFSNNTEIS
jgi:hypothetical protein